MIDERIDFSQLEPHDIDALVQAIAARAAPTLAVRRARTTTIVLGAWWRPVAAAAAIVAMTSAIVLALEPRKVTGEIATTPTGAPAVRSELARALGVPPTLAVSLSRETVPTAREFLRGLGASR